MMPHELFNKSSTLHVVAMRIQETGTYNAQYLRPYTTDMDHRTMDRVVNMASQAKETGQQITAIGMASLNDGRPIVTPSTQPEAMINIANGWNERRFRFLLTVDQVFHVGGVHRYYLTGYSTHADIGHAGGLDRDMQFYINSVVRTRIVEAVTPMNGMISHEAMINNRHVIANNNWEGSMSPNQLYMMRPEDIYTTIGLSSMTRGSTDVLNDTRIMAQRTATTSDLVNGLPHMYASKILNTYISASNAQSTYEHGRGDLISDAQKLCINDNDNPFIVAISRIREFGYISNSFTINEMCRIDPTAYEKIQYFPLSQADYGIIHSAGQTSDWHGQDGLTIAAIKICQAVPGLMGSVMLQNINFSSTNSTLDSMFRTTVAFADSMNKENMPMRCNAFVTRFEQEVLRDITANNQISYYLEVRADSFGETWVKLSFNNGPMFEYVVPSFCDNLLAPIITSNNQNALQISSDFGTLLDGISETSFGSMELDLTGRHI